MLFYELANLAGETSFTLPVEQRGDRKPAGDDGLSRLR